MEVLHYAKEESREREVKRQRHKELTEFLDSVGVSDIAGVQKLFKDLAISVLQNDLEGCQRRFENTIKRRLKFAVKKRWGMYRFPSKQIGVSDFGLPTGVTLSPENRWVKKADVIPWEEIEVRYAALFRKRKKH